MFLSSRMTSILITYSMSMFICAGAFAQNSVIVNDPSSVKTNPTTGAVTYTGSAPVATASAAPVVSSTGGQAAQAANSNTGMNVLGIVASAAAVIALKGPCAASPPWPCIAMGLAAAEGVSLLLTKSGSENSQAGFSAASNPNATATPSTIEGTVTTAPNNSTGPTSGTSTAAVVAQATHDFAGASQALQASGVSVSPDGQTVTLPNGKTVPSSAFATTDGMKAAGMSGADISAFQSAMKTANDAATVKIANMKSSLDNSGGGSGGGNRGSVDPGEVANGNGSGMGYAGYGNKLPGGRAPAKVSGLSRNYGSDRIGLASDDIFEMVHGCYADAKVCPQSAQLMQSPMANSAAAQPAALKAGGR